LFKHDFIEGIPELVQVNTEHDGRYYKLKDCETKFTSVTTMLNSISDKSFLDDWKKRVGEKKAAEISFESATRGTLMHKAAEQYLLNKKTIHFTRSKYGTMARNLFNQIKPELNKIDEVMGLEQRLFSKHFGLAGTADCVGVFDGKLSLIDFKNSRKPKRLEWIENYFIQCTIYSMMLEEITGIVTPQLVVIIGVYGEMKPQVFVEERSDYLESTKEAIKKWISIIEIK